MCIRDSADTAGVGSHMIKYTTPGVCFAIDSVSILVKPRVDVSIDSISLAFCGTASAQTALVIIDSSYSGMAASKWSTSSTWPVEWTFGSSLVTDTSCSSLTFNPTSLGSHTDSIFYRIDSNEYVCGDTAVLVIGIDSMEVAKIDSLSLKSMCADEGRATFSLLPS